MPDWYESLGGLEGCRKLSTAFYARVARDPVLIPVFPSSFHCAVEALATFLAQFLGGPCVYSPQRWHLSLREAHLRFQIGQKERDAWMANMRHALAEIEVDAATNAALCEFFEQASTYLVNRPVSSNVACPHGALAPNWDRHLALEQAVVAIRTGNFAGAMTQVEDPRLQACFERDPAAWLSLLAIMIGSGRMDDYVARRLTFLPELARGRHVYERTLLHDAAAAGNLRTAQLLLDLGADPNGLGGHTPLYEVGNSCRVEAGGEMVRLLVKAGADVNAQKNVKRCTALHMAARRGNVRVAEALLECGAKLELRDSAGDTPLRRAVNCGKTGVAALLLFHGADAQSEGSRGLTPAQAARTEAMKRIFSSPA